MMAKNVKNSDAGSIELEVILDKTNGLYQLANILNWDYLIEAYGPYYEENNGRPGVPIRVMVGLHYLKYLENESDDTIVEKFVENPYWQYFCGYKTFQHRFPCHPTSLGKWRKRIGEKGLEKLLSHVIDTAKFEGFLPEKLLKHINVDTTVQEKAIAFPTDSRLLHKAREKLVKACHEREINLRQSYKRLSKKALLKQGRYRHASQLKRAKKEDKKIKNYLGRVIRDIERKVDNPDSYLVSLLAKAKKLFFQKKNDKNKIYSLHAPEVECIAKGKANKKYEFGCKVSIATTVKDPWVISISAEHGNPYDGKTLCSTIKKVEKNSGVKPEKAFVDKGYRGKEHHPPDVEVYVSGKRTDNRALKKLIKQRSAIEPIIGHLKNDHRMSKNRLLGKIGDKINAILSGCAFNLRKMIRLLKERNSDLTLGSQAAA